MIGVRSWILIIAIILSILAIAPNPFIHGVTITYIKPNSLLSNLTSLYPIGIGSIITQINNIKIYNSTQFYSIINSISNSTINLVYKNEVFPYFYTTHNISLFVSQNTPFNSSIISVTNIAPTNLIYGTDLTGGTIITLYPNSSNSTLLELDKEILLKRLDVYGISGVSVNILSSYSSIPLIQVVIPSISEGSALSLVSSQGNFVAKINNAVIINSSNKSLSVLSVCTSPACPYGGESIQQINGLYQFTFGILLSSASAQRLYNISKTLAVLPSNPSYLNGTIDLYLNNKLVSSLQLGQSLQQGPDNQIIIQGFGSSYQIAEEQMKNLQAILQSGSLPIPLKIVGVSYISSKQGSIFISQIYLIMILEFLVVSIVTLLRYRNLKIAGLIIATGLSEILIVLGVAAAIHWTLDTESFAGILASVGVAIDDQIIITDEVLRGSKKIEFASMSKRLSRAFSIITISFFLFASTMLPLLFAQSTLFIGFALTSILAYLIGLLISRPAYAELLSKIY